MHPDLHLHRRSNGPPYAAPPAPRCPHPPLPLPLALLASACGGNSATVTSGGDGTDGEGSLTLNVTDQKGSSEAMLRAAGELDALDYRIKWSTFTSGPPLLEAVNAEAVDIGGVGNTPPVFAAGAGSKITVVAVWHGASRGEAVLVPNDSSLTSAAQPKGRSVAVAQGSSAHYRLIASREKAGLTLADVEVKYLQPADALAASPVPVTVDQPLIDSEQRIADAFTEPALIPERVDFARYVDDRFNGDLPPSTTAPRGPRESWPSRTSSRPPCLHSVRGRPHAGGPARVRLRRSRCGSPGRRGSEALGRQGSVPPTSSTPPRSPRRPSNSDSARC